MGIILKCSFKIHEVCSFKEKTSILYRIVFISVYLFVEKGFLLCIQTYIELHYFLFLKFSPFTPDIKTTSITTTQLFLSPFPYFSLFIFRSILVTFLLYPFLFLFYSHIPYTIFTRRIRDPLTSLLPAAYKALEPSFLYFIFTTTQTDLKLFHRCSEKYQLLLKYIDDHTQLHKHTYRYSSGLNS
jgi:hypothetical protein